MNIKVRKFQESDATKVSKIMRAAFRSFLAERYTKDLNDRFTPSELIESSLVKSRFTETISFVAIDHRIVVGYVKVTSDRNGLGMLQVVGVDADSFGKGIGTMLMKAAERFWVRKKQRKISTCVAASNQRALIYYIKNGFVPEGYCRDHFIAGVDDIILGRFL